MIDTEGIVIEFLNRHFGDKYYVADSIPAQRPKDYCVTVECTGGTHDYIEKLSTDTIAIQTWGHDNRLKAYEMALELHEKIIELANEDNKVANITCNRPYNWTEREPRYQFLAHITVKE